MLSTWAMEKRTVVWIRTEAFRSISGIFQECSGFSEAWVALRQPSREFGLAPELWSGFPHFAAALRNLQRPSANYSGSPQNLHKVCVCVFVAKRFSFAEKDDTKQVDLVGAVWVVRGRVSVVTSTYWDSVLFSYTNRTTDRRSRSAVPEIWIWTCWVALHHFEHPCCDWQLGHAANLRL